MRPRRARFDAGQPALNAFAVLLCVLGAVSFLASVVVASSLSRALSGVRLHFEGFDEREQSPIVLEVWNGRVQSTDGTRRFAVEPERGALSTRRWAGTPFTTLLDQVSREGKEYILFLVRPDGITTFETFRDVLVLRNDDLCSAVVEIPGPVAENRAAFDQLPAALRRRARLSGNRLSMAGTMTTAERASLVGALGSDAGDAVATLFDKSAGLAPCVDHGVELLPAEWKLEQNAQGELTLPPERP
jgi:hypothetical protein